MRRGRARVAVLSSLSAEGSRRQRDVVVRREQLPAPPSAPPSAAAALPAFATPTPPPTPPPSQPPRRIPLRRLPQPPADQNEKQKAQPLRGTVAWEQPKGRSRSATRSKALKAPTTCCKVPKSSASKEESEADEVDGEEDGEAEREIEEEQEQEEEEKKEKEKDDGPSALPSPLPPSPPPGSPSSSGPDAVPATIDGSVRSYDPHRYTVPQEAEPETGHTYDWRRYAAPEDSFSARLVKSWERNGLDHGQAAETQEDSPETTKKIDLDAVSVLSETGFHAANDFDAECEARRGEVLEDDVPPPPPPAPSPTAARPRPPQPPADAAEAAG
ncbi:hypothetical protein R5R35_012092 [Gryllus longicercus]|uniref:Uncharacterized protein n=1 Tax=Gryllus longicercus TaxID=2509291 RepID=A0AAN9ZG36_9ORTH